MTLRVAALLLILTAVARSEPPAQPGTPWNVVLISLDTLRADHLSCYGYARRTTPNLDGLAARGVLFENAIAASSWTVPSHMSLFTGLYPGAHGVESVRLALDRKAVTLAEALRAQGWKTAAFVSGPSLNGQMGFSRGFEMYDDFTVTLSHEANLLGYNDIENMSINQIVTNPIITRLATEWLRKNAGTRFFLFLHYWDVHHDYIPPAPYDRAFDPGYAGAIDGRNIAGRQNQWERDGLAPADLAHLTALYDGEIAHTDAHVGAVLRAIEDARLTERTIVIIVSDHGEAFMEHGTLNHGNSLHDELVRVPLILCAPALVPAGRRLDGFVSHVDVMPTVLGLLQLAPPGSTQGVDLSPALRGTSAVPDRLVFSELNYTEHALRAARCRQGTLIVDLHGRRPELWFRPEAARWISAGAEGFDEAFVARMRQAAAKGPARPDAVVLTPEKPPPNLQLLERLKSLGYVQ